MEDKKKTGFFRTVLASITDFDSYQQFAIQKIRTGIKYLFLLMFFFVLFVTLANTYQFGKTIQEGIAFFKTDFPNLTYQEGTLEVEQTEALTYQNDEALIGIVIVDTKVEEQAKIDEYSKKIGLYDNGILILKDRIVLKTAATTVQSTYLYKDIAEQYGISNFNKEDMVELINGVSLPTIYSSFFFVMFIYLFVIYLASTLVDAIILTCLGYLVAWMLRMRLKWGPVFNMAVHALTLPLILNAIYIIINMLTGFTIKYFMYMYTGISYIYIITAILIIRSNFIKQQMEINKIKEIQQQVKEELERQKEDPEEEKRREPKEKEQEKEKKENPPEEPEGSKA